MLGIGHYAVSMLVEPRRRGSVDAILRRESHKRMISHPDGSLGAALSDSDHDSAGDNALCAVASRSEHVLNASVTRL